MVQGPLLRRTRARFVLPFLEAPPWVTGAAAGLCVHNAARGHCRGMMPAADHVATAVQPQVCVFTTEARRFNTGLRVCDRE